MGPEGVCATVVRADLVSRGHNSMHNTLAAAAAVLPCAARAA